jgi:excisionase family DNA binding protein
VTKKRVRTKNTAAVFSVEEAAALLKLGRVTIYKAVKTGKLPSIRVGRKIGIPKRPLLRILGKEAT